MSFENENQMTYNTVEDINRPKEIILSRKQWMNPYPDSFLCAFATFFILLFYYFFGFWNRKSIISVLLSALFVVEKTETIRTKKNSSKRATRRKLSSPAFFFVRVSLLFKLEGNLQKIKFCVTHIFAHRFLLMGFGLNLVPQFSKLITSVYYMSLHNKLMLMYCLFFFLSTKLQCSRLLLFFFLVYSTRISKAHPYKNRRKCSQWWNEMSKNTEKKEEIRLWKDR